VHKVPKKPETRAANTLSRQRLGQRKLKALDILLVNSLCIA
jgi:hypothetical protein